LFAKQKDTRALSLGKKMLFNFTNILPHTTTKFAASFCRIYELKSGCSLPNLFAICQTCLLFAKPVCCLPNLCAICQTCALFAKPVRYLPNLCAIRQMPCDKKAFHLVCSKKFGKNVGEIDPK